MSRTVWHPVWRRCVTGHWQYITVCKYNFYLCHHCIISLCLFIRPLRTQSPFFFLLAVFFLLLSSFVCCFQSTEEDFRTLEGKIIIKKKKKNLLFPLHCDGELHSEAVWDVRKEEHRLWIWSEHHDPPPPPPPRSLVFQQTRGRGGEEVRGRFRCHSTNLRLTVAYFDPLSDEITVTLHHE